MIFFKFSIKNSERNILIKNFILYFAIKDQKKINHNKNMKSQIFAFFVILMIGCLFQAEVHSSLIKKKQQGQSQKGQSQGQSQQGQSQQGQSQKGQGQGQSHQGQSQQGQSQQGQSQKGQSQQGQGQQGQSQKGQGKN